MGDSMSDDTEARPVVVDLSNDTEARRLMIDSSSNDTEATESGPVMAESSSKEAAGGNVVKRHRKAHRKVKTGCQSCKTRRQKCDEQRPKCANCIRHDTNCSYATLDKTCENRSQRAGTRLTSTPIEVSKRLPSPRNNPPMSPSRDLNFDDLELLHQYITSTCIATSQLPEQTVQMQAYVPTLAQNHHFVMRGILANAAVHLSWLRPAQKSYYTLLAAKHHGDALPEFRSALKTIGQENYAALIIYSKGLVWSSFAWFDALSSHNHSVSNTTTNKNWLPSWFYLLRGSCIIVNSCVQWFNNEVFATPSLDDTTEFSNSLEYRRLAILRSRMSHRVDSPLLDTVLSALEDSFARASMQHQNTPLRNAINSWVGSLSNEYVDLLQKGEPWALVLMAHFCILVFRSETRWFMKGHAIDLLRSIVERLPECWHECISWAREEVGV